MPILNYTTQIASEKTIGEITKILVKHGATKIVTDYKDKLPSAVTFCLMVNDNMVGFSLPANYNGVLRAMKNDRDAPRSACNDEQALRVSWRIVKDWVEAQCAIVEANLAELAEVFLPYAVHGSGKTLYQHFKDNGPKLLGS